MFTSNTKENEVTLAKEDEIQLENQCPEPREMPTIQQAFDYPSSNDAAKEDSSNFTFSFFEAATQDGNQKSGKHIYDCCLFILLIGFGDRTYYLIS